MTEDEIDVDAPIPYVLTAQGHREVAEWRLSQKIDTCAHRWRVARGVLECDLCGTERDLPRSSAQSIPSYLRERQR
jgi:hypothetical protein